jgi:hypothetical protein
MLAVNKITGMQFFEVTEAPDDVAAEPPRQQLGEAQIEDQRSSTGNHVVCQQFLPQPRRRR